jgi:hypothetical protein
MTKPRRTKPAATDLTPDIGLLQAMSDDELMGTTFSAASYWTWKVVAKLIDGIPLTERREVRLFEQCTGRKYNRQVRRAFRRLIILAGRRAGKDRFESAVGVWRGALSADWRKYASAGEQNVVLLLGADKRQAQILWRYCRGLLEVPRLKREVVRQTSEVIEFRNGASLEIGTNDASLIRGRSAIAVLGSECCHWKTDEASASSDEEVVGAAEPSMSMCPDGGLLVLGSSVHRRVGYMYREFKELYGNNDAEDLVWFAPSRVMNPKLPASVITKAIARNAAKARAEYENVWRDDLANFIPRDVIEAAVDSVTVRPYDARFAYFSFVDASSGVRDAFAVAVAHKQNDTVILDCVLEIMAPFNTAQATAHVAQVLKSYGCRTAMADDHAKGWLRSELARHGITLLPRPPKMDGSTFHLEVLPLFSSGRVRLIKSTRLIEQYLALEQKPRGDREWVGHPTGQHDDLAVAVSGALWLADRSAGSALWRTEHFLVDGRAAEPPRTVFAQYVALIGNDRDVACAYFHVTRDRMGRQVLHLIDIDLKVRSSQSLSEVQARMTELHRATPSLQHMIEIYRLNGVRPPLSDVFCQSVIADEFDRAVGRHIGAQSLDHLLASGDLDQLAAGHINGGEVKIAAAVLEKPLALGFLNGVPGHDDDILKAAVMAGVACAFHGDRLTAPRLRRIGVNSNRR